MVEFRRPMIKMEPIDDSTARFIVEPLERGFGYTLGNSVRRVLLSSLAGAAVTSIKSDSISHEFAVIEGVREDVINIF